MMLAASCFNRFRCCLEDRSGSERVLEFSFQPGREIRIPPQGGPASRLYRFIGFMTDGSLLYREERAA